MRKVVTISDVAEKVGVSQSTISNYLHGRNNRISKSLREKIKLTIEELDYIPNMAARSVSSKSTSNTIGIVTPHNPSQIFYNTFYSRILEGIEDTLTSHGFKSIIIPVDRKNSKESSAFVRGLSLGLVSGLLMFDIDNNDSLLKSLKESCIPVIAFGYGENYANDLTFLATDHGNGISKIVEHFVETHNVKNIMFYAGLHDKRITNQRLEGYKQALSKFKIKFNPNNIVYSYNNNFDCYLKTRMVLERDDEPRAFIISQSDTSSFIRAVKDTNLIPAKDVRFILTEYYPINSYERYDYSFIKTPIYELGVLGVERLLTLISHEKLEGLNFLFPVDLIVAETCGCRIERSFSAGDWS